MEMNLLVFYCMAAVLPACLTAQARSGSASAKVEVIAFDTNGRFLGAPNVSLFESDDHKNLAARFRAGVADGIPFGIYRVEGRLPAYSSEIRYVRVYQPHVTVVLGLTFSVELPEVPPVLHGRVVGQISPKSFVRLVGIYSNVSMESSIEADGSFTLGGLSDGQFLLLIVGQKGILASRAVSIPYTGPGLEVEIGRDQVVGPR